MDLAAIFYELRRRKLLVVLALIPAVAVGLALAYRVSVNPPKLRDKGFSAGAASVQFIVDSERSSLGTIPQPAKVKKDEPVQATPTDPIVTKALVFRAQTLARVASSDEILDRVAKSAGIPREQLTATPPSEPVNASAGAQTAAEQRASQVVGEGAPYRILLQDSQTSPTVSVYVQAPDAQSAEKVAQSTVRAVRSYVRGLSKAKTSGGQVVQKLKISQLGLVNGGTVTSTPNRTVAIAGAVVTWIVLCVLIALFSRTRRRMRARSEAEERAAAGEPLPPAPPVRYPDDDAHTPPAPVHSRVD